MIDLQKNINSFGVKIDMKNSKLQLILGAKISLHFECKIGNLGAKIEVLEIFEIRKKIKSKITFFCRNFKQSCVVT